MKSPSDLNFEDEIFDKIGWYKNRYNVTRTKSEYDLIANAIKLSRKKARQEILKKIEKADWTEVLNGTTFSIYSKPYEDTIWGFDTSMDRNIINKRIKDLIKKELKQ